jgi:hypothetical protein
MKDQFSMVTQRTHRWKFEAGTTEIALGVIFFSAGLALLMPRTPTFYLGLFLVGIVISGFLVDHLQRRYIYPRIGYVEYRIRPRRGIWRLFLVLAASLVGIGGLVLLNHFVPDVLLPPAWFAPGLAFLVGFALILYMILVKQRRLLLLGLISIAAGLFLSPFSLGKVFSGDTFGIVKLSCYFLLVGVCSFFSGGCALRAFLRRNPLSLEEPPDEQ